MTRQILAIKTTIPAAELGGPGGPDPELCARRAVAVLSEAVGADMRLTSLALEVASHALGEGLVEIATHIDKRAKSIVFASVEGRAGAALAFTAQGLFSRIR